MSRKTSPVRPFGWRSAATRFASLIGLLLALVQCSGEPASFPQLPELATLPTGSQLVLSPSNPQIAGGTGQAFSLRVIGADGRVRDVTRTARWSLVSASGESVPSLVAGLVELPGAGRYVVRAELDGLRVSTPIHGTTAAVRSVSVSPTLPKVAKGTTQQFRATATMTDGTTQDVTSLSSWSVRDTLGTGVATITSAGLATGKNIGKSRIAARYSLTSGSTTMEVTPASVVKLVIQPQDVTIAKGTSQSFTATATLSDGTVQDVTALCDWAVMDVMGSGVASIDGSGTALGEAVGKAKVSAEYGGQLSETTLSISPAAVIALAVAPSNPAIAKGLTQAFTATARLSDGTSQDVSALAAWSASDVSGVGVASIDALGVAKGNAVGIARIDVVHRGYVATTTLEVKPATLLSVAISPSMAGVAKGLSQAFKLTATYSDGSSRDVTASSVWTSIDVVGVDVAAVNAAGVAQGRSVGQALIRGEHMGKSAGATLMVTPAVLSNLSIIPSLVSIPLAGTQAFKAQAAYTDGATVDVTAMATWSVSDIAPATGVATITAAGVATGKAKGQATVSASYSVLRAQATLSVGLSAGVCSSGGWCWRNPLPQGNFLGAVWSADANNAWAVSDFGVILKWNGSTWLPQTSGTTENLLAVWGLNANNVWAVGVNGAIVKWNGTGWTAQVSGTTANLSAIWGSDASNVWAAGAGGVILKWNGTRWAAQTSGSLSYLRGLWGSDANNVWAVGQGGTILKWDGMAWTAQTSGTASYLRSIWGTDAKNVWAVGLFGTVLKWDGTAWTAQTSGSTAYLRGLWGSAANNLYAIGELGVILRYDGTAWSTVPSGTSIGLNGIGGSSASDVWAVGNNGAILRYDGTGFSSRSSGSLAGQNGVWGSDPNNIWVVGDAGQVLKWNGSSFTPQASGASRTLMAVWGSDARNVWAVGIGGAIQYWNGTAWTTQASGTVQNLYAVIGTAANRVVAVGAGGTLLHFDGTAWTAATSPTMNSLYGVWGSAANDLWAVGYGGTALHFDGTAWTQVPTGATTSLTALWGTDSSNFWVVGEAGTLLRYSSGSFAVQVSGTTQSLYGLWGSSASRLIAVGTNGTILTWNGTAWSPQASGCSQNLNGIWGSGSTAWAVGPMGTILQYAP